MCSCQTCKFAIPDEPVDTDEGLLVCCRFPPIRTDAFYQMGVWPRVRPTEWCGEYAEKE